VFSEYAGGGGGLAADARPARHAAWRAITLLALMSLALTGLIIVIERLAVPWATEE
jgi:hypothetical protein